MQREWFRNGAVLAMILAMVLHVTACGTILYPERKGQKAGRLDPAIVILDGIGLLFFLVPGVIAFAVDFSNGTIYLPSGQSRAIEPDDMSGNMVAVKVGRENLTENHIELLVKKYTGKSIDLSDPRTKVISGGSSLCREWNVLPDKLVLVKTGIGQLQFRIKNYELCA